MVSAWWGGHDERDGALVSGGGWWLLEPQVARRAKRCGRGLGYLGRGLLELPTVGTTPVRRPRRPAAAPVNEETQIHGLNVLLVYSEHPGSRKLESGARLDFLTSPVGQLACYLS